MRLAATHAARLRAQLLSGPRARDPAAVVHRLLAVQAQDERGARLAVRSRSTGLRAADVDAALNDGSMVISWLNRGTLHLVAAADFWWLHPITTPQMETGNRRRLQQEGVSAEQADRGVAIVTDAVRSRGPQTRAELRALLDEGGVPTTGQALVHVLVAAALRNQVVRGPMRGREHAFVSASDWLGAPPEPLARPDALARLAGRYLAGHGPADARDLAKWAGLPLGDARAGLDGIASELTEQPEGLVDLADRRSSAARPRPRLLGAFDPVLLGWVSREAVVGPYRQIVTANGLFRPCTLVDGRAVGTWGVSGTTLTVQLLEKVPGPDFEALRHDAHDVLRFLGRPDRSEVVFAGERVVPAR